MKILYDAEDSKDIMSLQMVQDLISAIKANNLPCTDKALGDYSLSTNVQTALENLLNGVYMNSSGVTSLQNGLKYVSDKLKDLEYTGGSGITVAGTVISHSNNLTLDGIVNSGEILTPDFGSTASIGWFRYDKQGHVTQTGIGGIKIPVADTSLTSSSVRPISSKAVYDSLTAGNVRATTKTVTYGTTKIEVKDKVQSTLEGFQTHLYHLYDIDNSLNTQVTSLTKTLNTMNVTAGSAIVPVYFKNGVPTVCQYTLGSMCAKSANDYLPLAGGTMTGLLKTQSLYAPYERNESDTNDNVPVSGAFTLKSLSDLNTLKTFIGTVITPGGAWNNIMSIRHRNGVNDGVNYGMYLRTALTGDSSLVWNKQISASSWTGERILLDNNNYKTYITPANIGAAASSHTHSYLPLSGGTVTGKTTFSGGINANGADLTGGKTGTSTIVGFMSFKNDDSSSSPKYPYTGFYQYGSQWQVNARNSANKFVHNLLTIDNETKAATFSGSVTATKINGYTLADACAKGIINNTSVSPIGWVSNTESATVVPTINTIAFWNGANRVGSTASNLAYCNKGAFGTAATKNVDTTATSGSSNLITSGGVAAALANKVSTTSNTIVPTWWCGSNTSNTAGYYHFMTVTMAQNEDFNMTLLITNEFTSRYVGIFNTHIRCDSSITTNAPDYMSWLVRRGWAANAIIAVVSGLTVKYYINQTTKQYGGICFKALSVSSRQKNSADYTTVSSTAPTTGLTASATSSDNSTVNHASNADNARQWNGLTDDTMTANTTDTRLMVLNGSKVQYRLLSSFNVVDSTNFRTHYPVVTLATVSDTTAINNTITLSQKLSNFSFIWVYAKGAGGIIHDHLVPTNYLYKVSASIGFKDEDKQFWVTKNSDTQIRIFEAMAAGAEKYTYCIVYGIH